MERRKAAMVFLALIFTFALVNNCEAYLPGPGSDLHQRLQNTHQNLFKMVKILPIDMKY